MSTPARFALEMNVRADQVERAVNRIVVLAGRAIAKEVIATTPVDTSQALSNWIGSLGGPASGTRPAVSSATTPGATADTSGAATQSTVWAAISNRRTGQDLWISNNLPYINDLNVGNIAPRLDPPPDRTPYPRFAERAMHFGSEEVVRNARRIFK